MPPGAWLASLEFEIVGVNIDLFCIPMPDVADLRARVLRRIGAK